MVAYVMNSLNVDREEADRLRRVYWREYGTTLAGLMAEHDLDPEPFMADVHDVDFSILTPDPVLRQRISQLQGRKIIYTNGSAPYAGNVLAARGLDGLFDDIYGVEHASYRPKPEAAAFAQVFARAKLDPTRAAMFEDEARNLAVPHALGLRTVHVAPSAQPADHIHHHTDDLSGFLAQVVY